MQTNFGPEFFSANRDRLRAAVGDDTTIVIAGSGVMQRGGDEPSPFHQDSNFWYLTGLNIPDLTLVLHSSETYVIVPGLSASRQAFDGAHDVEAYAARSGISVMLPERAGWQRLRQELQTGNVATLKSPARDLKRHGIHLLPFRGQLITKLRRISPNLEVRDIRPELSTLRCIKQREELTALQQAIDITSETLRNIAEQPTLNDVSYEYELEAAISYSFRSKGATGHAFAPIVGAGKHSTTLHYLKNDGPILAEDVIVLDIGAEVDHYAADITRTVSQRPMTGRKAEVFKAVAAVQDFAFSQIKPGVMPRDYELAIEAYMGEQLKQLGLISDASRQNIRRYFPHATSHFLGLDTHDVGDYREPWQPNMVITCEPGIYIPEEAIGVRIEDDILITETGYQSLSAACPRELTPVQ